MPTVMNWAGHALTLLATLYAVLALVCRARGYRADRAAAQPPA